MACYLTVILYVLILVLSISIFLKMLVVANPNSLYL